MTEMEEFLRDDEPFMTKPRTLKNCPSTMQGSWLSKKVRNDDARSFAWQCGYGEAQE
jgi:hypothetical protein